MTYLEHKQLLPQDGQRVEAAITDVWFGVGVGGLGPLGRAVGADLAVVLAGVRGGVEAGGRGGGRGSGRLGGSVRGGWREERNIRRDRYRQDTKAWTSD